MLIEMIITIFLFYFFAILQSSFFVHFNLFGAVPNLVFILFFLVIFFGHKKITYIMIIYAIFGGLFLDIFSNTPLGLSVIAFLVIGYLEKNTKNYLQEREEKHPFVYFLPIFLICLVLYDIIIIMYLRFADPSHAIMSFGSNFFGGIIYNLIFAPIGFWVFKKVIAYVKKI